MAWLLLALLTYAPAPGALMPHCPWPCLQAIELALEQAGGASAETTIFLDDSTRNIVAGHQKGLTTVLVSHCRLLHTSVVFLSLIVCELIL